MKKVLYTILSILSIVYIVFLSMDIVIDKTAWDPDMGWFTQVFDFIVRFGGVAIIFCFALVNFAGSPLKTAFFIVLIVAIVAYIIVLVAPDFFCNLFNPSDDTTTEAIVNTLKMIC